MLFNARESDHDSQLFWKRFDGLPQLFGPFPLNHALDRGLGLPVEFSGSFPHRAAHVRTSTIDRHPPRHSNQPRTEAVTIPELMEVAKRFGEGFLGDILGVL